MLRTVFVSACLLFAACGGAKPKSEAEKIENDEVTGGMCCCEYVQESGEGDEMSEEMVQEMMDPAACEGQGGTCDEAQSCAEETPPGE